MSWVGPLVSIFNKSTLFAKSISQSRLMQIVNLFGFSITALRFLYLDVPIFKGRVKACYPNYLLGKLAFSP
jgi:hypothetical protein